MSAYLERAEMSAAEINDLPDSAFAYIEAGGKKDSEGKTVPRSLRHFPLNDEAHVRNALARAPQSPFGEKAMPKIRAAAKKMGIEMSDPAGRSDQAQPWSDTIMRTLPLDDFAVRTGHATCERCGKNATGRMVDAYAAVFNVSAEIHDQHGRYNEVIDPVAFNRTLKNEIDRVSVYYHHGMTLHGTPSGEGSFPLGHPSVIRTDNRGVLTSTHYSENDVGERALTLIKEGTITGQSFSGSIRRSDPHIVRGGQLRPRKDGTLPTVRRLELGLREYGPTPSPAYTEAQILATRAAMGVLFPDQRSEGPGLSGFPGWAPPPPQDVEFGAEDSRGARSGRQKILRLQAELRRMEMLTDGK
jgi:HK97 family phage prohead protease